MKELGAIRYYTGGTSGHPKQILYDRARWQNSVRRKQDMFEQWEITNGSRVAVCHPFSPWAIGGIHAEGAMNCGADVLPLGLKVNDATWLAELISFEPTVICGTSRHILRWGKEALLQLGTQLTCETIFVAGELLVEEARRELSTTLGGTVVNVYGMAEFDMVGSELPGSSDIWLHPDFEFDLYCGEPTAHVQPDANSSVDGYLMLRERGQDQWTKTCDRVLVRDRQPKWRPDGYDWNVSLLGRGNQAATLIDGANILEAHVLATENHLPEVKFLQVIVHSSRTRDRIELHCSVADPLRLPQSFKADVINKFLQSSVDIADSVESGCVSEIEVIIWSEVPFNETERGKVTRVSQHGLNR